MGRFGGNAKKEEGQARKKTAKQQKEAKKREDMERQEAKEWTIGAKDLSRQQAEEQKRAEKLARKKEREELEAKEVTELAKYNKFVRHPKAVETPVTKKVPVTERSPFLMTGNPNRPPSTTALTETTIESYVARNVDDATLLLDASYSIGSPSIERHPERRMKAAYAAFEEANMPRLKDEHPALRLSQLRQILAKEWKKSPDNPFNQTHVAYNVSTEEQQTLRSKQLEQELERLKM